jgi:hypothetical protein
MSWNYRLVRYRDGSGYGLHEIVYDGDGQPTGMTEQPISFGCDRNEDAVKEISEALKLALNDVTNRPIFDGQANSQLEGRSTAVCRPGLEPGGGGAGAAAEPGRERRPSRSGAGRQAGQGTQNLPRADI